MEDGTTEIAAPATVDLQATVKDAQATVKQPGRFEPVTIPLLSEPPAPAATPGIQYAAGAAPVLPRVPPRHDPWVNPTLTDASDPDAAGLHDAPIAGAAVRRRRGRTWLAITIAALVIAGGAVAYVQFRSHPTTPAQVVQQYFADLATDDTAAAMALVEGPGTYTSAAYPLLSASALADPASRPGHVTIVGSSPTTVAAGGSATAVSMSYAAGGRTVRQTITAVASSTPTTQPFLLDAPFITVAIGATGGRTVTVNGLPYPTGVAHTLAFPGAYVANSAGTALVAGASAAATYDTGNGAVDASIALPAPAVAPGATAAVSAAVNRALDACAASTSPTPPNCPFQYNDTSATLKWTIVTYPTVSVQVDVGGTVTFGDGVHAATVQYEATTTDFLGFSDTDRNNATVDVAGVATLGAGGVTVTFTS
jgi:hypothetical protein